MGSPNSHTSANTLIGRSKCGGAVPTAIRLLGCGCRAALGDRQLTARTASEGMSISSPHHTSDAGNSGVRQRQSVWLCAFEAADHRWEGVSRTEFGFCCSPRIRSHESREIAMDSFVAIHSERDVGDCEAPQRRNRRTLTATPASDRMAKKTDLKWGATDREVVACVHRKTSQSDIM
jgi:hypothetical protein